MFLAYGADRMATIAKMNTTDVDAMLKFMHDAALMRDVIFTYTYM